jgi:hypothetical protein
MRRIIALTLVLLTTGFSRVHGLDPTDLIKDRAPTSLEFYEALTVAKQTAASVVALKPEAFWENIRSQKFLQIPSIGSTIAFGAEKDGIYSYIWASFPDGGVKVHGLVVEFYSGGIWIFTTAERFFWFDPSTKRMGELSATNDLRKDEIFNEILWFIDRDFDVANRTPEAERNSKANDNLDE